MKAAKKSGVGTQTIAAGEFKAKCLQLMDEVNSGNARYVITKYGKPYAELVPVHSSAKPFRSVIGRTPNVEIKGDIISPLAQQWTLPEWEWD